MFISSRKKGYEEILLPKPSSKVHLVHATNFADLETRASDGKGLTNAANRRILNKLYLPQIERLITEKENWHEISDEEEYHFPGYFIRQEKVAFCPDISHIKQAAEGDKHFLFHDVQLSKGPRNRDIKETWEIDGKKTEVTIWKSLCKGVKQCCTEQCDCVVLRKQQINRCKNHPGARLVSHSDCKVMIFYVFPSDLDDQGRWIGIEAQGNEAAQHNHLPPVSNKLPVMLKERIKDCVERDPTKSARDIQMGYGMKEMPCDISCIATNKTIINRCVRSVKGSNNAKSYIIIQNYDKLV